MLPVSSVAAMGAARMHSRIAVASGCCLYAHDADHSSSSTFTPRHTNHATSQGSSAQGTKMGTDQGAYT